MASKAHSDSARPSGKFAILTFLLPFLHLPSLSASTPISAGFVSLHTIFAGLKLAGIASLVAVAAGIPLIAAGVPCLSRTAAVNNLGGHLGTLTALSLLRLLDALDPDSRSTLKRALPDSALTLSAARIRLIILLVLMTVIGIGGGLFIIARTYAGFARYRIRFDKDICGGLDMVYVAARVAPSWRGMSEEAILKWFRALSTGHDAEKTGGGKDLDVLGVFAVPYVSQLTGRDRGANWCSDTSELQQRVTERTDRLSQLERLEASWLRSLASTPIASANTNLGVGSTSHLTDTNSEHLSSRNLQRTELRRCRPSFFSRVRRIVRAFIGPFGCARPCRLALEISRDQSGFVSVRWREVSGGPANKDKRSRSICPRPLTRV